MNWIHLAKVLALAAGVTLIAVAFIIAAMAWFLDHPKD